MGDPLAGLIIRSILVCYAAWGSVSIIDLANCESKRPGTCESQRAELRGAVASIPATLLAWLTDSPARARLEFNRKIGRTTKTPQDDTV